VHLADYRGKNVILYFSEGAGCQACITQMGEITKDQAAFDKAARRRAGQRTVTATLDPQPVSVDLGGPIVRTWAYGDTVPGPPLRATAGNQLKVTVTNHTPMPTSVHWHGIAIRNDMDGVPGLTQQPVGAQNSFTYQFTVPDPGTYFYHPHDIQLDRGLYGVLVVDDPHEPGRYDHEWILVLDDWTDGVIGSGRTPDQVLAALTATTGMDMGAQSPILGGAGDVVYPYYLANGRIPDAAQVFTARPKQRARIRIVNACSDTAFRIALTGHRLTVTHTDGYPVVPAAADALIVGMGERYDVEVALADGLFPLVALVEGKEGEAVALIRTGSGTPPKLPFRPAELDRQVLLGATLQAADAARLTSKAPDRTHALTLGGTMSPYVWTINGKSYPDTAPLLVRQGERSGYGWSTRR
jgi:FtsP/CotA-like multicopper oxidase with cupredoxin domain